MSLEELRVITIVYVSALAPLIIYFYKKDSIPLWVPSIYLGSFLICSLSWELWFTYGWIDGDPVNVRRSEVLNTWIPIHLNWLLNSLADAGTISMERFKKNLIILDYNFDIFYFYYFLL